jgi:hypothetical protein
MEAAQIYSFPLVRGVHGVYNEVITVDILLCL